METHVLIPRELRLKVRPNSQIGSASLGFQSISKLLEHQVSVISTVVLPKGLRIHPAQGTVRCGKLEMYSLIQDCEVSLNFLELRGRFLVKNFRS